MLSGKLVHLIEAHRDEILTRAIAQIHREPLMTHTRALVEADLRQRGEVLLENLGHWLSAANEEELAHKYELHGRQLSEEGVPLHETVRAMCLMREKILDFAEEHILSKDALELYAEEELDRRLGRFFDLLTVHLVRGYERSLRHGAAAAAS